MRRLKFLAQGLFALLLLAPPAAGVAQDEDDPVAWSKTAATGALDLCRDDAPDAAAVAEHGEVWGWPHFVPYLEHPDGFQREAGGESRRTFQAAGKSAFVELTVQSGQVTAAAPAGLRYFRCELAADQPIAGALRAYFTAAYGPPAEDTPGAVVWLKGDAAGQAAVGAGEDAAWKAAAAASPGARLDRVELSTERGLVRAKWTVFLRSP